MQLLIAGHHQKAMPVNFYELGTDRTFSGAVKNDGGKTVEDVRLWTAAAYEGKLGIRLQGIQDWTYPGGESREGFSVGNLNPSQQKDIELKVNIPSGAGQIGEHLVPIFLGHSGEAE